MISLLNPSAAENRIGRVWTRAESTVAQPHQVR